MLMTKLPWLLTFILALLAIVGWMKALGQEKKKQIKIETRKEIIREIISQQHLTMDTLPDEEGDAVASTDVQDCLDNPKVQQKIDRKAKLWAEEISNQVLENYKAEESFKEQQKVSKYMDAMEDFFTNSINKYTEEFEVEDSVAEQLHGIVEEGFAKQRALYEQKVQGEITDEEYGRLSNEIRQEDKEVVRGLLGEEGAKDFGQILREEGKKAREEKYQTSLSNEETK
jgi:hypothetical protein